MEDMTPQRPWKMPQTLLAVSEGYSLKSASSEWQRVAEGIGGDSGLLGLFDLAHFHDVGVIPSGQQWTYDGRPADPSDLWYSFVCEAIRERAAIV